MRQHTARYTAQQDFQRERRDIQRGIKVLIIGFANGCYDLYHEGHRHFLTECRRRCDYLIVAVNSDEYCREHKGRDRPYDELALRMMHVRSIAEAAIPFSGREEQLVMEIRPNVIFKGYDHGNWDAETWTMRKVHWKERPRSDQWDIVPIVRISHLPGFSTSAEALKLALNRGTG